MDKTILVVGDHQAYADVVAEVLRHYGFQVTAVYTPDAALVDEQGTAGRTASFRGRHGGTCWALQ
jgi:CheY-like chemotaxis protein